MSATLQPNRPPGWRLAASVILVAVLPVRLMAQEGINLQPSSPFSATDVMLVRDWLEQETRRARQHLQTASTRSSVAAAPVVELIAIYGVGHDLGAELRIGGVRHILVPERGAVRATDRRGSDSIVAEHIAGPCLSLRYRRTIRRLCLAAHTESVASRVPAAATAKE